VDVRPIEPGLDVSAYDVVVIGSAVFDGRWTPEAEAFARGNLDTLAGRPV
jgi:menaquinone-dependent protoporphyrinogen oxidase